MKQLGGIPLARVSIEEKWWSDPRRNLLIRLVGGSSSAADGSMLFAWRVAQEYSATKDGKIPIEVWETLEHSRSILEAKLACASGQFVTVRGASEHFEWISSRRKLAASGGKRSAESRKAKYGSSQPKRRSKPEASASSARSKPEPSYSSSYSSSSSNSELLNPSDSTRDFIAAYAGRFKTRYGSNPQITGRDSGIAKRLAKGMSSARFGELLDAFFSLPDSWLVKKKHPLAAFESSLNEIVVFAGSGDFTTRREAAQVDDGVALSAALARAAT